MLLGMHTNNDRSGFFLANIYLLCSEACLAHTYGHTLKGTQNQYLLSKVCTYYQGRFMYMRYTLGQNEEYLLSRSMY